MSLDNAKEILAADREFMNISLFAAKTKVLIVGGGRAGYIKAKSFAERGCRVTVLSLDFYEKFKDLQHYSNIEFINKAYTSHYIIDKHLIVISVNNEAVLKNVMEDCDKYCKLYLNCTASKKGSFIIPAQGNTKNIYFSVNTAKVSPNTSKFLLKKMKTQLSKYDDLSIFNAELRKQLKNSPYKNEILEFTATDDFNFFIKKKMPSAVLKLFYSDHAFMSKTKE